MSALDDHIRQQEEKYTMADPRFFRRFGPFRLEDIAAEVGAALPDPSTKDVMICDIASLETAGPGELSFFNHSQYLSAFHATRASAVVTTPDLARNGPQGVCLMSVAEPQLAFARIGLLYYPSSRPEPQISADARIDPSAVIGAGARIDAGAIVGAGAEVGPGCHIACHAVIGSGVVLGNDCAVGPNSCISYAIIGARVRIASGVSIGGQGFGFVPTGNGRLRIPQLGRVIIENDVEIGANCAVDRGSTGDTVIGAGTVLDNLVHIAHNVRLGRYCVICGQVGIAGSTVVGDGVMIGGQVGISDHLHVGSGARIASKSGVIRDVKEGEAIGGYPAMPIREWHRQTATGIRLSQRRPSSVVFNGK
ncbi:MAG: UDP-3-O-(3-hydroxymyristoyl)glucosamine N-acyltransferase [Xanthobacteraceae bacterium]